MSLLSGIPSPSWSGNSPGSIGGVDEEDADITEDEEDVVADELLELSAALVAVLELVALTTDEELMPSLGFLGKPLLSPPPQAVKPARDTINNSAKFFMVSP